MLRGRLGFVGVRVGEFYYGVFVEDCFVDTRWLHGRDVDHTFLLPAYRKLESSSKAVLFAAGKIVLLG